MTTRLYFELNRCDRWYRADWEERLGGWMDGAGAAIQRVFRPEDAEFILETSSEHSFIGGRVFTTAPHSHYRRHPEKTFAWDAGDHPTGRLPGLFCSLDRRLARPGRHRGFSYPLRVNRLVCECPPADARQLFGFSGNVTSPLRARLFTELAAAARSGQARLRRTENLFHRIYDPAGDAERARFVDDLRQCRFILCPRGNGLSSIRLFESLEAGRVPVILSDALLLPACVDWSACSVTVPEHDLARIPELLAAREADWPEMARRARSEWERCFGNRTLLPTLVAQLREIASARRLPETTQRYFFPFRVLPACTQIRAKALVRRWQSLRRHR